MGRGRQILQAGGVSLASPLPALSLKGHLQTDPSPSGCHRRKNRQQPDKKPAALTCQTV